MKSRNGYTVKVLADSVSEGGARLTTLLTRYPRFIHAEMLRHRMFSHSVASSRAIPTEELIEQVRTEPFIPEEFNKRVRGMGVGRALPRRTQEEARDQWVLAAHAAVVQAEALMKLGVDKSRVNRLLEPFLFVWDIISATEWENFFALRCDTEAQPEFQLLANMILDARDGSFPQFTKGTSWHLPMVDMEHEFNGDWERWKRVSAARCARVSFDNFSDEPVANSLTRADMLIRSGHLSPFEHVARSLPHAHRDKFVGNFKGWVQFRKQFPNEDRFDKVRTGFGQG
jgi:thymidylate synthase ThyX